MTLAIHPIGYACETNQLYAGAGFVPRTGNRRRYATTGKSGAKFMPADDVSGLLRSIAANADMDAFQKLFQSYSPQIRAYLLKVTRDRQAAEDLMQETMLTIWRKAAQFDPERGPASAWIFTIARNTWIDAWRRQRRPEFDPGDPALVAAPEPDATDVIVQRERYDALHEALQSLPQEQAELIRLSFFDEASHSAIAQGLGLPVGTVKSRIRLAFRRLRVALEIEK